MPEFSYFENGAGIKDKPLIRDCRDEAINVICRTLGAPCISCLIEGPIRAITGQLRRSACTHAFESFGSAHPNSFCNAAASSASSAKALVGCETLLVERIERMPERANSFMVAGGNSAWVTMASMVVAPGGSQRAGAGHK